MNIYNEIVQYEHPLLSMKIFGSVRASDVMCNWHYHKEIEILAVLEGLLEVSLEDGLYTLTAGDIMLIGSSQLHRDRSYRDKGLHYIVFQFDLERFFDQSTLPYMKYFTGMKRPLSDLNASINRMPDIKKALLECIQEIYEESRNKQEGYEIAINLLIQKIILILVRNDEGKVLNSHRDAGLMRLQPVLDYVEQHLTGKIQVEDASRIAQVSYYYFVKYFKKALGISFTDYVNYRKIKKAERLLLTRDDNIAQIGEAVGMNNMAHFYKVFKKFNGFSPKEFRLKMAEWKH